MKQFEGSINQINIQNNQTIVLGWLWDSSHPDEVCQGTLSLNDKVLASFECSQYREDLQQNGIGDGKHAYEIILNHPLAPENIDQLKLHPQGKKEKLYKAVSHEPANIIDNRSDEQSPIEEQEQPQQHDFSEEIDKELEEIYAQEGSRNEVLEYFETLKTKHPENYSIHHKLGDFYFNQDQFDESIKNYNLAIQFNPHALWSYHNLSVICIKRDDWPKSDEYIEKINAIHPEFWNDNRDNFLVQLHLGERLTHQNKIPEALNTYKNAFFLNPNSIECLYQLIQLHFIQNSFIELLFLLDEKQPSEQNIIDEAVEKWIENSTVNNNDSQGYLSKLENLLLLSPNCQAIHQEIKTCKGVDDSSNDLIENDLNDGIQSYENNLVSIEQFLNFMDSHLQNERIT